MRIQVHLNELMTKYDTLRYGMNAQYEQHVIIGRCPLLRTHLAYKCWFCQNVWSRGIFQNISKNISSYTNNLVE